MKQAILILPEILLAITLGMILISEITHSGERLRPVSTISFLGLGAALVRVFANYSVGPASAFGNSVSIDGLSLFFKGVFIVLAAFAIGTSARSAEISRSRRAEFCAMVVATALAGCMAASASDLILAFLCLQMINVIGYFLAGFGRDALRSTEAAIKYMGFAVVSGALLVYGLSLLFATTGSLNIQDIHRALLARPPDSGTFQVVFILCFIGLSFQLAAFPMHFWAPDVIQGAPTPSAAVISVAPRAAALAVAIRFLIVVFAQPTELRGQWQPLPGMNWPDLLALVAGASMLWGAMLAYRQVSAKRLIGSLLMVESGFLLLGLLVLDEVGLAALLYNLLVDLIALMGTFYVLSVLHNEFRSDRLADLTGALRRFVPESVCLLLFAFCLAGLPPTPGFIGKFTLVGVALRHHWLALAALAIASQAISVLAIARLALTLVGRFRDSGPAPERAGIQRKGFLAALVIPMVLIGVFAEFLINWAGRSLGFIFW